MSDDEKRWRLESYGSDTNRSIGGYCVVRGFGWRREISQTFPYDRNKVGTHQKAYLDACALLRQLRPRAES